MKRLFGLLVILLAVLLGLGFTMINAGTVPLNYYFGTVQTPLSLLVVLSLCVGAVLGVLATTLVVVRLRSQNSRLRRHIDLCEQELKNLREIPIKDHH